MNSIMLHGNISQVDYKPFFYFSQLRKFNSIKQGLSKSSFLLEYSNTDQYSVSRWVSPKRTRSYPYARVYDTFSVGAGTKKVTIIPIIKDEGKSGDRDFLQFDTISMMSLLNVHVILTKYVSAEPASIHNKITNQQFDFEQINREFVNLSQFHSSAVHWNQHQLSKYYDLAMEALNVYREISRATGVEMHSYVKAENKIHQTFNNPDGFAATSRKNAMQAQSREANTIQASENITGIKGSLTIKNHLGGEYFLTTDEVEFDYQDQSASLIEAKHSSRAPLPSNSDIKDGLLKMMLFCNLDKVFAGEMQFIPKSVLKLTSGIAIDESELNENKKRVCEKLRKEAQTNGFELRLLG